MSNKPVQEFLSSLRARLIGLVLLAVLPALGLILYTAAEQRREAVVETQENLLRLVNLAATNQKQVLESTRQLLVTLARLPEVRSGNQQDCTRLLVDLHQQFPIYTSFGVSDPNGDLWCSSLPFTQAINLSDQRFFRLVRETNSFAIGDYQIGTLSRRATIVLGYPILDQAGQLQAVLSAGLDLEQINASTLTPPLQEGATLTVVDRNGTVLLRYPDAQQWLGKSSSAAEVYQIVLAQTEGTAESRGLDGAERIYAFTRLGDDPVNGSISIRIGVPKTVAFASANRLLTQNLINLGLVALLALAAAWFLGDVFLVRKVQSLLNTTQKLRQGDLTARTSLATDAGELGQLARSFDEMAAALEQRDQAIATLNLDLQHQLAELQNSEARYRLLAEAIPQLVWITNAAGQNEYVNQQFRDYTGLTLEAMLDWRWLSIIHPDDLEKTRRCWLTAVSIGQIYKIEYRFRRADGVYRWFLGQGIPLKDEQGRVNQWVGTCTDIEPQKQIEQARSQLLKREQAARETAEQANRIKDEFLAVLSHELRSPMNPILGWSKLLRDGRLDADKAAQAVKVIDRNAQIQMQLIDDLLDISRILRGKLSLNITPVDLNAVIANALETVQLSAAAKSIAIQSIPSPLAQIVNGDAGRLQQVIWNLLSNAVKFTPPDGQIEVTLSALGKNAQIQVKDSGKGINPEFLPYIFEHFRQEDGATTRKFGGLGLGLAIARQMVELHGGQIWVESPGEGQGATFTVQIPLASESTQMLTPKQPTSSAIDLTGLQILVVDDEPDSRDFVAFVLEQAGAIVTCLSSGIEAVQKVERFAFDLIVSDIGMPEMDGYMLMRQIRSMGQNSQIPAIALTAYAGEVDQQQALKAGFQQHLSKPVQPEELVKTIATMIKRQGNGSADKSD